MPTGNPSVVASALWGVALIATGLYLLRRRDLRYKRLVGLLGLNAFGRNRRGGEWNRRMMFVGTPMLFVMVGIAGVVHALVRLLTRFF